MTDHTHKTFGHLLALAFLGLRKNSTRWWQVKCLGCGAVYPTREDAMKKNKHGCLSCAKQTAKMRATTFTKLGW